MGGNSMHPNHQTRHRSFINTISYVSLMEEQGTHNPLVAGSNPAGPTTPQPISPASSGSSEKASRTAANPSINSAGDPARLKTRSSDSPVHRT